MCALDLQVGSILIFGVGPRAGAAYRGGRPPYFGHAPEPPMPPRRPADDEDDPRPRRKGTRKKATHKSVLPLVLLGGAAAALVIVIGVVMYFALGSRPPTGHRRGFGREDRTGRTGQVGRRRDGSSPPQPLRRPRPPARPPPPAPSWSPTAASRTGPSRTRPVPGSPSVRRADRPPGWTVTRGSVDYIGPYWQHADGRRSIDLNGNEPGAIAQTLRTRPGANTGHLPPGRQRVLRTGRDAAVASAPPGPGRVRFDTAGRRYEDMGWAAGLGVHRTRPRRRWSSPA